MLAKKLFEFHKTPLEVLKQIQYSLYYTEKPVSWTLLSSLFSAPPAT